MGKDELYFLGFPISPLEKFQEFLFGVKNEGKKEAYEEMYWLIENRVRKSKTKEILLKRLKDEMAKK